MQQNPEFCLPEEYATHNYFRRANKHNGYKEGKEIVFQCQASCLTGKKEKPKYIPQTINPEFINL